MFTATYELGDLRIAVEIPDALAKHDKVPMFSAQTETDEEFDTLIDLLGGPDNFTASASGPVYGKLPADGEIVMVLYPPRPEPRSYRHPAVERMLARQTKSEEE